MDFTTCDLADAHPQTVSAAAPLFRDFGQHTSFFGRVSTVRVQDDNVLVRAALAEPAAGRVLVIDGAASLRCALLGDVLGALAVANGWQGVLINGCVRDSGMLATLALGIKALATHPLKSGKTGKGERDVEVAFAGCTFRPGDWLYADGDGVLVSAVALHGAA
jgi:regulator of ribonuclease activity A